MTTPYLSYLEWITSQQSSMEALLEKWVNINSWSENPIGLANILSELHSAFNSLEADIKRIPLPPHTKINSKGEVQEFPSGAALQITKYPHLTQRVLLCGHMDTVYPPACSFQKAERIDSQKLQGPGAADMKGGLIVLLKSLEALERSPWAGKMGWDVIINPDEEIGSTSSESLFIQGAKKALVGLIFEPSFADGSLVSARKGSANFTVVARGKAAHVGRDFSLGRNAINAVAHFIVEVNQLNNSEKGITINVGQIEGGGPVNIVPELAICRLNVRMVESDDFVLIKNHLHAILQNINPKDITLTLHENYSRGPKPFDKQNQSLFEAVKSCGKEIGIDIQWKPSGGVCDGNILSSHGLPTIDTLGVVGGNIHTFEEYVLLNSLSERTQLTSLFLMQMANGELNYHPEKVDGK